MLGWRGVGHARVERGVGHARVERYERGTT